MKRAVALFLGVLFLMASVPLEAGSCWECRYSPNGWGNCRLTDDGYSRCSRVIVEEFSGKTDCDMTGAQYCISSGGGGGGDDCWWTDLEGNCIFMY